MKRTKKQKKLLFLAYEAYFVYFVFALICVLIGMFVCEEEKDGAICGVFVALALSPVWFAYANLYYKNSRLRTSRQILDGDYPKDEPFFNLTPHDELEDNKGNNYGKD